jgi:hypothetical protein
MHPPNKESERDNFSYYDAHCPEGKIELTDGQLIVGNSPAGTMLLFDHILRGWSLDAATAFGSIDQWMSALREAYGPAESIEDDAGLSNWSGPDFTAGGAGKDAGHRATRQHISMSFFEVGEELGGEALGGSSCDSAATVSHPTSCSEECRSEHPSRVPLQGPAEWLLVVRRLIVIAIIGSNARPMPVRRRNT